MKNVEVEFIKSSGGVFEVMKDGEMIFSKRREGRFPQTEEIISRLT